MFEQLLIDGVPIVKGLPDDILIEPCGELIPGTKVTTVGRPSRNGKDASASRVDNWTPWIEYTGKWSAHLPNLEHKTPCILFKLPPDGVKGNNTDTFYVLYQIVSSGELMRNVYKQINSVRFFRSVFTEFETNKTIKGD